MCSSPTSSSAVLPATEIRMPVEIENCHEYLYRQVELIQPRVICSLGQLLDEAAAGRSDRDHAPARSPEELTLGRRTVRLYPIFHPAAALYTPRMLETLREDFSRLPELLALPEPAQDGLEVPPLEMPPGPGADGSGGRAGGVASGASVEDAGSSKTGGEVDQLDLF